MLLSVWLVLAVLIATVEMSYLECRGDIVLIGDSDSGLVGLLPNGQFRVSVRERSDDAVVFAELRVPDARAHRQTEQEHAQKREHRCTAAKRKVIVSYVRLCLLRRLARYRICRSSKRKLLLGLEERGRRRN